MFMGTPGNVTHLIEFSSDGAPRRRGTHPPISRLPPRASTHPARPAARRTDTRWPGDPCRPPTHPPSAPIGPFHPSNGPARRAHGPRFGPFGRAPPPPAPIWPPPAPLRPRRPPVRASWAGPGRHLTTARAVGREGWAGRSRRRGGDPARSGPVRGGRTGGNRTRFEAVKRAKRQASRAWLGAYPLTYCSRSLTSVSEHARDRGRPTGPAVAAHPPDSTPEHRAAGSVATS